MTAEVRRNGGWIAPLLGFVAGYVDTVGFIALMGLFTAHVTGNFVLIGASLSSAQTGVIAKLLALPVFVVAVVAATVFVRLRRRSGLRALNGLLVGQSILLAAFAAVGFAAQPIVDVDAPLAVTAGLLGVFAMGLQNAASRLLMAELPPTTVMTGGVTQSAIDLTQLLFDRGTPVAEESRARLAKFVPPVVAFALGAMAGAVLFLQFGFNCMIVPIAGLMATGWLAR